MLDGPGYFCNAFCELSLAGEGVRSHISDLEDSVRATIRLLAIVACLLAPSAIAAQDADEVIETLTAMWDAIEHEDIERYASYIHPDFTAFGEYDTYLSSGKESELRGVADWIARYREIHTEMHQPQVTIRGDVAWITYYWSDSSYHRESGARETSRGKSTRIFVREDGRWLCIHGHYTAVE